MSKWNSLTKNTPPPVPFCLELRSSGMPPIAPFLQISYLSIVAFTFRSQQRPSHTCLHVQLCVAGFRLIFLVAPVHHFVSPWPLSAFSVVFPRACRPFPVSSPLSGRVCLMERGAVRRRTSPPPIALTRCTVCTFSFWAVSTPAFHYDQCISTLNVFLDIREDMRALQGRDRFFFTSIYTLSVNKMLPQNNDDHQALQYIRWLKDQGRRGHAGRYAARSHTPTS